MSEQRKIKKYKKFLKYLKKKRNYHYFLSDYELELLKKHNPSDKNDMLFLAIYPYWQKHIMRLCYLEERLR